MATIVVAVLGCAVADERSNERLAIEASIYSAVVESLYMGSDGDSAPASRPTEVLLRARTEADGFDREFAESWLRDSVPGVPDQLFRSFREANKESGPVPPFQVRDATVRVLPESALAQFFDSQGDGWEGFRQAYPKGQGILTLSRVGLSPDAQWALVYAEVQADYLAGGGVLYVLRNLAGTWRIEHERVVWIS